MSSPFQSRISLDILQQLIRIQTPQPYGDEKNIIGYILSLFPDDHLEKIVIDHGENRASLILIMPGEDRSRKVALAGHLDTMPVGDRSLWTKAPFGAEFDGERVYGRGASDMKGGLTSMLLSAIAIQDSGTKPPVDVLYCFTADEEAGGTGAKTLIGGGYLKGIEELLLVKPTNEKIGLSEKGALWIRLSMYGKSSHAAMPEKGSNTIYSFFQLYEKISSLLKNGKSHSLLGNSTCVITSIKGGDMPSVIPEHVEGVLDIRTLPHVDHDEFIEEIDKIIARMKRGDVILDCTMEIMANRPPVGMHSHSPLLESLEQIYAQNEILWKKTGINYFTDASILVPALGVPFVILGPGDEDFVHQTEEFVELSSVERMARVFIDFIKTR